MVNSELLENGTRVRHWSDAGYKLRQEETGLLYEDAVDTVPCRYTYTETEEPLDTVPGDMSGAVELAGETAEAETQNAG